MATHFAVVGFLYPDVCLNLGVRKYVVNTGTIQMGMQAKVPDNFFSYLMTNNRISIRKMALWVFFHFFKFVQIYQPIFGISKN